MFEQWLCDQHEVQELSRMNAILIGSFTNSAAARDMLKSDNPDYTSTDEDFEKSLALVEKDKARFHRDQKNNRRKRRQSIKDNV